MYSILNMSLTPTIREHKVKSYKLPILQCNGLAHTRMI